MSTTKKFLYFRHNLKNRTESIYSEVNNHEKIRIRNLFFLEGRRTPRLNWKQILSPKICRQRTNELVHSFLTLLYEKVLAINNHPSFTA